MLHGYIGCQRKGKVGDGYTGTQLFLQLFFQSKITSKILKTTVKNIHTYMCICT